MDLPEDVEDDDDSLARVRWPSHVCASDRVFRELFLVRVLQAYERASGLVGFGVANDGRDAESFGRNRSMTSVGPRP